MHRVAVTPDHIAAGVRHCPSCCPVGRGIADLFPAARRVCVVPVRGVGWVARIYGPGRRFRTAVLPPHVRDWLDAYVAGGAVGVVEFDLTFEE